MNIRAKRDSTAMEDTIAVFGFEKTDGGNIRPVEKLTLAAMQEPGIAFDPMLTMTEKAATQLMDDLWNAGIRPSMPVTREGEMSAKNAHIGDLMEIVRCLLPSRTKA